MRGKAFLDTNILVYTFDADAPAKRDTARRLVANALAEPGSAVLSWQVVQEFLDVATAKFAVPLSPAEARLYLSQVLRPLCEVYPDPGIYDDALGVRERYGLAFYDCLILASATRAGCRRLYSEDFPEGFRLGPLEVVNPFRRTAAG